MKSTRFHCNVWMTKYILKTIDRWTSSWLSELSKTVILTVILKSIFVKRIVLIFCLIRTAFLSSILNLKNAKNLKNTREELMAIPDIPIDGEIGVYQKMRKKKWKKIFIEEL